MSATSDLYFAQIPVGEMANFAYLIGSREARECLAVDPAWSVDALLVTLIAWSIPAGPWLGLFERLFPPLMPPDPLSQTSTSMKATWGLRTLPNSASSA